MTTKTLTKLLIAAVLASSAAYAQQTPIQSSMDERKVSTQFKMGGLRCIVLDAAIRCTPGSK